MGIKDDVRQVNGNLEKAKAQSSKNSLKVATLQLSKEILDFVVEQDSNQPSFILGSSGFEDAVFSFRIRSTEWQRALSSEFHKLFDRRIANNLQSLKAQNVDVNLAVSLCVQPRDVVTGIRKCGVEIGKLGQTFP